LIPGLLVKQSSLVGYLAIKQILRWKNSDQTWRGDPISNFGSDMPLYCSSNEIASRYSEWLGRQENSFWEFIKMRKSEFDFKIKLDEFINEVIRTNKTISLFEPRK